jgi:hypothetical protein
LWFVITGGADIRSKTGCETCGWREVKALFEKELRK